MKVPIASSHGPALRQRRGSALLPRLSIATTVLIGLLVAGNAGADPVRIISGTASIYQGAEYPEVFFRLVGEGFEGGGVTYRDERTAEFTTAAVPEPLSTGAGFNLSTHWTFDATGNLDNGISGWLGEFQFIGGDSTLSCSSDDWASCRTSVAPFSFVGTLAGYHETGALVLRRQLTGRGRGSAYFVTDPDRSGPRVSYDFTFEDAAPVAEPGTVILLTTGLVALVARQRRRPDPAV
jgi:hypothetical protein